MRFALAGAPAASEDTEGVVSMLVLTNRPRKVDVMLPGKEDTHEVVSARRALQEP